MKSLLSLDPDNDGPLETNIPSFDDDENFDEGALDCDDDGSTFDEEVPNVEEDRNFFILPTDDDNFDDEDFFTFPIDAGSNDKGFLGLSVDDGVEKDDDDDEGKDTDSDDNDEDAKEKEEPEDFAAADAGTALIQSFIGRWHFGTVNLWIFAFFFTPEEPNFFFCCASFMKEPRGGPWGCTNVVDPPNPSNPRVITEPLWWEDLGWWELDRLFSLHWRMLIIAGGMLGPSS